MKTIQLFGAAFLLLSAVTARCEGTNELEYGDFEVTAPATDAEKTRFADWGWTFGNDPIEMPKNWRLHDAHPGKLTIIKEYVHSGSNACRIEDGWVHYGVPVSSGEVLEVRLWAKGEGSVAVMLFLYGVPEGDRPRSFPTAELSKIALTDEWQEYTYTYVAKEPELMRAALAFGVTGSATFDDVSVVKVSQ